MKTFYLYKVNGTSTTFGLSSIQELIKNYFASGNTEEDQVEIYSYRASNKESDPKDNGTKLKVVATTEKMDTLFKRSSRLRAQSIESLVSKKKSYWIINVHSWGTHLMVGTEAEAEKWRSHKANWERSVAHKTEVPRWLYDQLHWHQKNEMAFNVAIHKSLRKDMAERILTDKALRLQEYLKERD